MAILDPIQGLVDYVEEIKPYHTKIVEVLIEYIHEELVDVTITENFDMCVNFGFPELTSKFILPIIAVNTVSNTFTVSGNQLATIFVGQHFEVFGSTENDDRYTATGVAYDGTNTVISVSTSISGGTADGDILQHAIEYCPDSGMYGTSIPQETVEAACVGGFGEVWDTLPVIHEVLSGTNLGSPTGAEITIPGDFTSEFTVGRQAVFEFVTDLAPTVITTEYLTVASSVVDNSIPASPKTVITTEQGTALGTGSPASILTTGAIYLQQVDHAITDINEGTTGNTFTIAGDITSTFVSGSLAEVKFSDGNDGIYYVLNSFISGANTVVHVAQNIPFPSATNKGSLSFKIVGFDEIVFCSNVPVARIEVFFSEKLQFSGFYMDFADEIIAYNFENTDSNPYGGDYPLGTTISATEPTITTQDTAPVGPTLFDLWFDTNSEGSPVITNGVLRQWNGTSWVGLDAAYWLDSDDDQLYQRVYRTVNGNMIDTGWVPITLEKTLDGGVKVSGAGEIQPIATQSYAADSIGSPAVGQTQYTLSTPVPAYGGSPVAYPVTNPELLSVTVNNVPAGITLDSSTTFTVTSPTVNVGDTVTAIVKDRNGVQSNVLYTVGLDTMPHRVVHDGTRRIDFAGSPLTETDNVTANGTTSFEIYGGNFAYHFFGPQKFKGSTSSGSPLGLLGEWQITNLPVIEVNGGASPILYSVTIDGDYTTEFSAGTSFYFDHSINNKGWYTVVSSSLVPGVGVGSPTAVGTVIEVVEEITKTVFTNDHYAGSPTMIDSQTDIIQNYSKDLGTIQGALYNKSTFTTTVIPSTPGDADVNHIEYTWLGPLQIDVDMIPFDLVDSIITDPLGINGKDLPQNLAITSTDSTADTITVSGNYETTFVAGTVFEVINHAGSPSNNGSYTVLVGGASPAALGATYDAGTDTTIIPVVGDVPLTIPDGGSPIPISNGVVNVLSVPFMNTEIVQGANYLNIVAVDLNRDTYTVLGDRTDMSELIPGAKITVQNAYSSASPVITNNGTWTVDKTFYNGGDIVPLAGADDITDTFTIDGNYADKFIPGFEFTVYDQHEGSPEFGGSPANDGNYIVRLNGSPNIGATYDAGTDTTIIPVSTPVPGDFVSGSPHHPTTGLVAFPGTDETWVYVTGEIHTDTVPYGRIQLPVGTSLSLMSGNITETFQIGWTVTDWFQYPILSVDLVENTIYVAGDARGDVQIGQDFVILGDAANPGSPALSNNGNYKVRIDEDYRTYGSPEMVRSEVDYDGTGTTITVYPDLIAQSFSVGSPPVYSVNGWIEPNNDAQAIIAFSDTIGTTVVETAEAVVISGGSLVGAWDYPYWDVGGYDESMGTVIYLYSGTFE